MFHWIYLYMYVHIYIHTYICISGKLHLFNDNNNKKYSYLCSTTQELSCTTWAYNTITTLTQMKKFVSYLAMNIGVSLQSSEKLMVKMAPSSQRCFKSHYFSYEIKNQQMSLFQFYSYIDGSLHVLGPQAHPQENSHRCSHNSHQDQPQHTEHAARTVQPLNQWLCEQLYEFSWGWACRPETCRDPSIYE
jgi:hypothetical protein